MIITCKCLNVSLDLGKVKPKGMPLSALKLTAIEGTHKFFSEGVAEIGLVAEITKNVPELIVSENIGNWVIQTCINCCLPFFATSTRDDTSALISAGLIADPNTVAMLKSQPEYSSVFRILIKVPFYSMVARLEPSVVQSGMAGLQHQFTQAVQKEAEKTDDNIRNFTERQLDQLSKFRDRAVRDHDALVKLLCQAEESIRKPGVDSPITEPLSPTRTKAISSTPHIHPVESSRPLVMRSQSLFCPLTSSVHDDGEGVFCLDEIQESVEAVVSDAESDTDHDDSSSHDEGIDIHLKKVPMNLAKSLPVNVPIFPNASLKLQPVEFSDLDDERFQEEPPTDIAASIKALARSVHGDVFGDLPRPRFSSQI